MNDILQTIERIRGDIEGYLNDDWDVNRDGWQALADSLYDVEARLRDYLKQLREITMDLPLAASRQFIELDRILQS